MKYTLGNDVIEKLVFDNERPYFTEEDFSKLAAAKHLEVHIDKPSSLQLLEGLHNSATKFGTEIEFDEDGNSRKKYDIPYNPDGQDIDVIIGEFEGKEEAYIFAEGWGFNPRYLVQTTTVIHPEVFADSFGEIRFEVVADKFRKYPEAIMSLPKRATKKSAGYDFTSPDDFQIQPGETVLIYTDIKCALGKPDIVLNLYLRSNIGVKRQLMIANGTGIIDADYYSNPTNDGNIIVPVYNYGTKVAFIGQGERFAQGLIMPFLKTSDDDASGVRTGGLGHTGA